MKQDSWDHIAVTSNRKHTLIAATLLGANDDSIRVNIRQLPVHRPADWTSHDGAAGTVWAICGIPVLEMQLKEEDRFPFSGCQGPANFYTFARDLRIILKDNRVSTPNEASLTPVE